MSTPASASGETPSAAEDGTAGTGTRLAIDARAGSRLALSRLLTAIESRTAAAEEALRTLYPAAGSAHVVGITGPPGGGKSTLVAALVAEARAGGRSVAVLAIDPSSPVTGGAILGDRIRMQQYAGDPDVFIRSMASRGHLGGLAGTTAEVGCRPGGLRLRPRLHRDRRDGPERGGGGRHRRYHRRGPGARDGG